MKSVVQITMILTLLPFKAKLDAAVGSDLLNYSFIKM